MKKLSFLMTLSLLSSLVMYAQKDTSWHPQPDSIIKLIPYGEGRYSSYLYTIGGKLQTAEDVKIRLLNYTPSAAEYAQAKNHLTWAWVSFGGFTASSIAAVVEYANNNKHAGETTGLVNGSPGFIYQQHSLTGAYIFTGLATGLLVSTIINMVDTHKHGRQALALYNRRFE
jgi:hypothetical protein